MSIAVKNPGGGVNLSIGGNTAGVLALISSGTATLMGGANITLSQNGSSITISGAAGGTGGGGTFTLNGTSDSVSLVAGTGIGFATNASTITISSTGSVVRSIGPTGSLSSGPITISGVNLTVSSNGASVVQLSVAAPPVAQSVVLMSGNTFGTSSSITSGTFILQAVSPVGLSQSTTTGADSTTSNIISVFGPNYSAGGGLGLSTTNGIISYSQTAQSSQTVVSAVQMSGNTSGTSSVISNGTVYLQAVSPIGISQSTTPGANSTTSNILSIFGPSYSAGGGLAVSTTNGIVSYSHSGPLVNSIGPTGSLSSGPITVSGVNLTVSSNGAGVIQLSVAAPVAAPTNTLSASGTSIAGNALSLALAAGANISLQTATAASSMTVSISAISQTANYSLTALGNTTSSSAGTGVIPGLLNISGAGIASVGVGASSITISVPAVTAVNSIGAAGSLSSGPITVSGVNLTVSSNGAGVIQLSVAAPVAAPTNTLSASGTSIAGNALSVAIAAGANVSLQTATAASSMTISVSGLNALSASGFASSTGTMTLQAGANLTLTTGASIISLIGPTPSAAAVSVSATSVAGGSLTGPSNAAFTTLQFVAGSNIGISQNGQSLTFSASGGGAAAQTISLTQNVSLPEIAGSVASASGTVTGTAGFGSSLFLQRIFIPGTLNLSEIDLALAMSFPATNQGAGTMSQSFILYSFGNSSSLASVMSASSAFAWQTGTSTSGAVVSLTQFQGGWSIQKIHPMTFASTSVGAGDYVVGNLLNFAQGSSTWTVSLFGAPVFLTNSTTLTNVTSNASLAITNLEATKTTNASTTGTAGARTILTASTTQSIIPQYLSLPSFVYIGTNSTTSAIPSVFIAGIMSTGAAPVAITLTSAAVTFSGTAAGAAPYFALVGA